MGEREFSLVAEAFASNFIAPLGPQLDRFEEEMSAYLGGLYCVGVSSGTAALHLSLHLSGVTAGDEVWVSSMTFAGGVFPILYLGATPVFFDLEPSSWTVSPDLIEDELHKANRENRLPKAIIPTDLYGQSVDLDRLEAIASSYDVKLIVDSAESLGAQYKHGRRCGTGGDFSIVSFNGNKIITAGGGGMLIAKSREMAERARFLATQARDPAPHYQHSSVGYNYRLSNILAAIGLGQLEVLRSRVAARRAVFQRYVDALEPLGVEFMPEPDGYVSSRWLTAALFPNVAGRSREDIRLALAEQGVESRPLWKPMHLQPLFAGARYVGSGVDESFFSRGLCLPSGSDLSLAEQDEVVSLVMQALQASTK